MYQAEDVCAVVPLLTRPEHPENLRFLATWTMIVSAGIFAMFWSLYLLLFATFDEGLVLGFHTLDEDQ